MRAWPHVVLGPGVSADFFIELFSILVNARTLCVEQCVAQCAMHIHTADYTVRISCALIIIRDIFSSEF